MADGRGGGMSDHGRRSWRAWKQDRRLKLTRESECGGELGDGEGWAVSLVERRVKGLARPGERVKLRGMSGWARRGGRAGAGRGHCRKRMNIELRLIWDGGFE